MRTTAMILIAAAAMCVGAASGRAEQPRAEDAFQPQTILALADRVYNHTLENPYTATDRNWIRATFYSGVMELYHATGIAKYREQAERWAEKHQWREGTEGSGMNKLFCAMTWAELYLLAPDAKKIEPTLRWLATDAPNSPGGAKIWFGHAPAPFDRPLYSDSLYGAPVFPMLYRATDDRTHLEMLDHVFWTVTKATLDEEDALYYRDPRFIGQKSPAGQKVLWSRGNGWVFAAFPRILRYLPEDAPGRERYVDLYRRMAASLAARQQPDGFWRSNLADPEHTSMPESSGTAFFIAGYAWGVRNGILDRETYLPMILRGWTALVRSLHPDGKLGWVQPVGDRPAASSPDTTHEYAAGLFLSAAGQVYLLVKEGVISPEAIRKCCRMEHGTSAHRTSNLLQGEAELYHANEGAWTGTPLGKVLRAALPDHRISHMGQLSRHKEGTIEVVLTVLPDDGSHRYGALSTKLVRVLADASGTPRTCNLVCEPDPAGIPDWQPNIQRPAQHATCKRPALLWTRGINSHTLTEAHTNVNRVKTEVWLQLPFDEGKNP